MGDYRLFGEWTYVDETHTVPAGASIPRYVKIHCQLGCYANAVRLFHADAPT